MYLFVDFRCAQSAKLFSNKWWGWQAIMRCALNTHRYVSCACGQQTTVSSATSRLSHCSSRRKLMPSMVILRFVYNLMYGTQLSLMAQFPVANWFGMEHTSPGWIDERNFMVCSSIYLTIRQSTRTHTHTNIHRWRWHDAINNLG